MITLAALLREGRKREAWLKYCGFIELSLREFMEVQERLLAEQVELFSASGLAEKLFGGGLPKDLRDFRRFVPLTTYDHYAPYLSEKREDLLPAKPAYWVCTSGKTGSYPRKWAPYPRGMVQTHIKNFLASAIFSTCSAKGEVGLEEGFEFLYAMAPPPYLTGMVPYGLKEEIHFQYLPPLNEAERMDFERRNREGFRLALVRGFDLFFGLSSVLVRMGEKFAQREKGDTDLKTLHPAAALRLAWGTVKSRLRRRQLLPKDLWSPKGIICAGTDTAFYKERIEFYWGRKPLEIYGGTEIGMAATQTWDYGGMVLFPDANFWEFIPEEEQRKSEKNSGYIPQTLLLPDLEPGKRYELVITNFRGGAFVRYRVGDMVKVISRRNDQLNIDLPQIVYEDRVDEVIDLAGFTRITERTLWEALKKADIANENWVARKTFAGDHPIVEFYLELPAGENRVQVEDRLHRALRAVDPDYRDLEEIMGYRPLRLVAVREGRLKTLRRREIAQSDGGWDFDRARRVNPPERLLRALTLLDREETN